MASLTSLDLPQYLLDYLDRILKANDFKQYSLQANTAHSMKGSGSELFSIDVTDPLCSKRLNIVCKIASFDENRRKTFLSSLNFARESVFYDHIQPMFSKFQEEKKLPKSDRFLSHPKCYGRSLIGHDNEQYAMVLGNVCERGFRMWNKYNAVPIENIRLVVSELGKFHGISMAMKDQRPDEFATYILEDTFRDLTNTQIVRDRFNDSFDRAIKSLKSNDHKSIMRDVKENFSTYLEYCVNNATTDRFGVLSHGTFYLTKNQIFPIGNFPTI